MKVTALLIPDVKLIEPQVFGDARGFFFESFNQSRYRDAGIDINLVQVNLSRSARGVLRGLHYQWPNPQGKLVSVLEGEVFDVAVDIRFGSPTFGQWVGAVLSAENKRQLWVPEGFAHGFAVTSDTALFHYGVTAPYDKAADASVRWNDARLAINWPIAAPSLSAKDAEAPFLDQIPEARLPVYVP